MPRKQRFKPSRKPKPSFEEVTPPDNAVVRPEIEDMESAQTSRTSLDHSIVTAIEDIERGR